MGTNSSFCGSHHLNTHSVGECNEKRSRNDDGDKMQQELDNVKKELAEVTQKYNQTKMAMDDMYQNYEQKQNDQNTKLMDTKHELQHTINKLTEIVDGYKQIESTQFSANNKEKSENKMVHIQLLNEKTQMLQDLVHKLTTYESDTRLDAQRLVAPPCNEGVIKKLILKQYQTSAYLSGDENNDDDDNESIESTSSLFTEEEIQIVQAKLAEIQRQSICNEEAAIRREMKELQKESDAARLHLNVYVDDESHLFRSGTKRKWDRASVINQKKEMEQAMTELLKQAVSPQENSVTLTAMQLLNTLSQQRREQKMEQEENENEDGVHELREDTLDAVMRKADDKRYGMLTECVVISYIFR